MKFTTAHDGFDAPIDDIEGDIVAKNTSAIRQVSAGMKEDLRGQIKRAGFGQRLANTWRADVYPKSGRSLEPATLVWSAASKIILSMNEAITIRPVHRGRFKGRPMLWIPTDNVPNAGRGRKATPQQVEQQFRQRFIILPADKRGNYLALVNVVEAKNRRGFRGATPRRIAQGRDIELRLMFVLVPEVRTRKIFDLQSTADHWAGQLAILLDRE